jgi:hypothetical protein
LIIKEKSDAEYVFGVGFLFDFINRFERPTQNDDD